MSVECPPGVVAGHVEQSLSIFTPTYIIKVSSTVTEAGNKISKNSTFLKKGLPAKLIVDWWL